MALTVPDYIEAASIQDASIRYQWDDWNEEQATEPIDAEFLARMQSLSWRAVNAFSNSAAEWVVRRFNAISADVLPLHYLEAAWAMQIDLRYCATTWEGYTHESAGWNGPVRRPQAIAVSRVEYTFEAFVEYGDPELSACWISNLARYVISDLSPYQAWENQVVDRLRRLFPFDPSDKLGDAVPREALDPNFDFAIPQTETLINRFLTQLDYRANPFLNTPDRMSVEGFDGTPYQFSIERDRRNRRRG